MILTLNLNEYVNLRREIRQSQKGLTMMSFWQIITPSSFFDLMATRSNWKAGV